MIKRIFFSLLLVILCGRTFAQKQIGVGAMAGITNYIGDFNPGFTNFTPDLMVGGMLRYTLSDFYQLRFNLAGGYVKGDPTAYKGSLISTVTTKEPAAFRNFFFSADARIEFAFMPFDPFASEGKFRFTPYYSLGVGIFNCKNESTLQLPIGIGAKYRLAHRWSLGVEWVFAKTFTDDMDNWVNIRPNNNFTIINDDWLTYININLVFQLLDDRLCFFCNH
jgi:hypothetical protein